MCPWTVEWVECEFGMQVSHIADFLLNIRQVASLLIEDGNNRQCADKGTFIVGTPVFEREQLFVNLLSSDAFVPVALVPIDA